MKLGSSSISTLKLGSSAVAKVMLGSSLVWEAAGGSSYLINETYEGTGTPTGHTVDGTVDFDATDRTLAGSQCAKITGSSGTGYVVDFTASGEVWVYMIINLDSAANYSYLASILDASNNVLMWLRTYTTPSIRCYASPGTDLIVGTYNSAIDTNLHIWIRYKNDGNAEFYASTDAGTKTLIGSTTSHTRTAAVAKLRIWRPGTTMWLDNLRIATSEIGTNPF